MAKLETLTKEQFDALSDELKEYYKVNQEGKYDLDGIGELKRAVKAEKDRTEAAIKAAVEKATADALKPYEGLDVEAAKNAIAEAAKAEEDKKKKAGDFDGIKAQLEERHAKDIEKKEAEKKALADEKAAILSNLKREKLANVLTEKGVLPDRVKYLVGELDKDIELVSDDNGFTLKKIGGIGDATEFDSIIETVKEKTPFFFAATGASGSGASGSQSNNGGQGKVIPRAEYDANPAAYAGQLAKGEATLADK